MPPPPIDDEGSRSAIAAMTLVLNGHDAYPTIKDLDRTGMLQAISFLTTVSVGFLEICAIDNGEEPEELLQRAALAWAEEVDG